MEFLMTSEPLVSCWILLLIVTGFPSLVHRISGIGEPPTAQSSIT